MRSFKYCRRIHINEYVQIICHGVILLFFMMYSSSFAADEITYDFEISGLENPEHENIRQIFEEASILIREKSEPLISVSNLRGNFDADIDVIKQILRAEGYYNSEISEQFFRNNNHFEINLLVSPGTPYHYGDISVDFIGGKPDDNIQQKIREAMNINSGEPARADPVVRAEANILNSLPVTLVV